MAKKKGLLLRLLGVDTNQSVTKNAESRQKMQFAVAGLFHRMDAFYEIAQRHRDFGLSDADFIAKHDNGRGVYEYRIKRGADVSLVPEPTNPHDRNAIAVYVDGKQLGYVPAELTADVRRMMARDYAARAYVSGGARKRVADGRVITDSYDLTLNVEIGPPDELR